MLALAFLPWYTRTKKYSSTVRKARGHRGNRLQRTPSCVMERTDVGVAWKSVQGAAVTQLWWRPVNIS